MEVFLALYNPYGWIVCREKFGPTNFDHLEFFWPDLIWRDVAAETKAKVESKSAYLKTHKQAIKLKLKALELSSGDQ